MNLDVLAEKLSKELQSTNDAQSFGVIRAALAQVRAEALEDDALVREIAMQLKPYQPINEDNAHELMNDIRDVIRLYAERVGRADFTKEGLMNTPTPRTDAPERIYLNLRDEPFDYRDTEGITWAEDRIEDSDPEYIRRDIYERGLRARDEIIKMLRDGDTCARHCEGTAYRIEARQLARTLAARDAELEQAREDLQFVERWANHHGVKPSCTAAAALSCIQHYPPIRAITESYGDGKIPDTPNPWKERDEAREELARVREELAKARANGGAYRKDYLLAKDALARAEAALAEARKNEARYLWLRERDWFDSDICCVRYPVSAVKLGSDCPSRNRLDAAIDAAIAAREEMTPETSNHEILLALGEANIAVGNRIAEQEARIRELEWKLTAMTKWLDANQPDVFRRGIWDAMNK